MGTLLFVQKNVSFHLVSIPEHHHCEECDYTQIGAIKNSIMSANCWEADVDHEANLSSLKKSVLQLCVLLLRTDRLLDARNSG